jgi:uncharacterized protein (TIGR03435 family)
MQTTRPNRRSLLLAACGIAATVIAIRAQAPPVNTGARAFEVASVKRNLSGSIIVNQSLSPGRYTGTNLSVADLLATIYAPQPRSHVSGGPDWMRTDRFDIVAKAEGTSTTAELVEMLHTLLVDRFKFAAHQEAREGDVYNLILARSDGRLGPLLRPSTVDCAAQRANATRTAGAGAAGQVPACPLANYPGRFIGTSIPLATLARTLVVWVDGREVRDRTELSGLYDVDLTWTPERLGPLPLNAPIDLVRAREAIDPNGPSLVTALQEQLGLKLESMKDKIDVLVIDHLEAPTED